MPLAVSAGDEVNTPARAIPVVARLGTSNATTHPWYGPLSPCDAPAAATLPLSRVSAGRLGSRRALNWTDGRPVPWFRAVAAPAAGPLTVVGVALAFGRGGLAARNGAGRSGPSAMFRACSRWT